MISKLPCHHISTLSHFLRANGKRGLALYLWITHRSCCCTSSQGCGVQPEALSILYKKTSSTVRLTCISTIHSQQLTMNPDCDCIGTASKHWDVPEASGYVGFLPNGSRGYFAMKSLSSGDLIMCVPRIHMRVLAKERLQDTCDHCFQPLQSSCIRGELLKCRYGFDAILPCENCPVKYCSDVCKRDRLVHHALISFQECKKAAWKELHHIECKHWANEKHLYMNPACRLRLKMALNRDLVRGGPCKDALTQLLYDQELARPMDDPYMTTNCRPYTNALFDTVGFFVDPMASSIRHSCCPNAVLVFDGLRLRVQATRIIKANEEILASYCDSERPYWRRQRDIEVRYGRPCVCPHCLTLPGTYEDIIPRSYKSSYGIKLSYPHKQRDTSPNKLSISSPATTKAWEDDMHRVFESLSRLSSSSNNETHTNILRKSLSTCSRRWTNKAYLTREPFGSLVKEFAFCLAHTSTPIETWVLFGLIVTVRDGIVYPCDFESGNSCLCFASISDLTRLHPKRVLHAAILAIVLDEGQRQGFVDLGRTPFSLNIDLQTVLYTLLEKLHPVIHIFFADSPIAAKICEAWFLTSITQGEENTFLQSWVRNRTRQENSWRNFEKHIQSTKNLARLRRLLQEEVSTHTDTSI